MIIKILLCYKFGDKS